MPRKIENVFDEPRLCEVVKAIVEEPVRAQIEFELIKLASLMSVGGNLNKAQIGFIASSLIEQYPHEAIADFKLCFERGAIGMYGEIQRMDGITIGLWFKEYLEEKYEVLENKLKKEKETIFNIPEPASTDEVAKQRLKEWKESIDAIGGKKITPMTDEEIRQEGKVRPKTKYYQPTNASDYERHQKHIRYIKANYDVYGEPIKGVWQKEETWNESN